MLMRHPLFHFFASLKLAVISLVSLAGILAAATVFESLYGMRGAHVLVYGTWWFAGVLFMLGTNVLCAALSRYPWKRHQAGFVITHLGIITILVGSFFTQRWGVDGNLPVREGQQDGQVVLNDLVVVVSDEERRRVQTFPFPESAKRREGKLFELALGDGSRLVVDEFLPRAVYEKQIIPSPVPGVGYPAVRVELYNNRFRVEEWLQPRHPDLPAEVNLGPALLTFQSLWTPAELSAFEKAGGKGKPRARIGFLVAQYQGKQFRLNIDELMGKWRRLGASPFDILVERYLPYAIVQDNQLVSKSNEPVNPALQIRLRDGSGVEERHTVFALFPEFSTLHRAHRKTGGEPFGVELKMFQAGGDGAGGQTKGQLHFAQSPDGKRLLYRIEGSGGKVNGQGIVKVGDTVGTGWMDLQFRVVEWLPAAVDEEAPRYVEHVAGGDSNFLSGIRVRREKGERNVASAGEGIWIMEGMTRGFSAGDKEIYVEFGRSRLLLPFDIYLEKFTIGHDPGTRKAATYESRVNVKDPAGGVDRRALISMNEPLNYGGYTFYQASYQIEEGKPPISVFSVNFDPGRPVKYAGSIIMVLGILVMFYMNPHYFGKILGRRRETP